MPRKLSISQFEGSLTGLQGCIAMFGNPAECDKLLEGSFPMIRDHLAEVAPALERIGMLAAVQAGIDESEALVRAGEYEKAEDIVLELTRSVMRASGTMERLEKRYAKAAPGLLH